MIRRLAAALTGLVVCLPLLAVPVAGHGANLTFDYDILADDTIVGIVTNHTLNRRLNLQVYASYDVGTDEPHTEAAHVLVANLAPHASSPFVLDPIADVSALPAPFLRGSSPRSDTRATGVLHVDPGTFAGDVYTGSITNEGVASVTGVQIFAARLNAGAYTDAKGSAIIASLPPGVPTDFSITFDAASAGGAISTPIATSSEEPFYTTWNNYFSDLYHSSHTSVEAIIFLADEGITTGCGNANFCPKDSVSRAQMAAFLDRALGLADAADQGFTDLGDLSPDFQQAINNIAAAGISGGCTVTPKHYCPYQSVTRGQMSKFIVTGYGLAPIAGPGIFMDDNGHFSEPYNNRMATNAITTGCTPTTYCPNSGVTREQMAVFIFRAENP